MRILYTPLPFLLLFSAFVIPIVAVYDGEREVNGEMIDCIGLNDKEYYLGEGWRWSVQSNPIVPSVFMSPIGVFIVTLTDIKCPEYMDRVIVADEPIYEHEPEPETPLVFDATAPGVNDQ